MRNMWASVRNLPYLDNRNMNGFLNIDLAAACKTAARHIWATPDDDGRSSCVVCGEPCTAGNVATGVPREMMMDQLAQGPIARGITR